MGNLNTTPVLPVSLLAVVGGSEWPRQRKRTSKSKGAREEIVWVRSVGQKREVESDTSERVLMTESRRASR